MKFDREYFDMGINRVGTRCEKWDDMRAEKGDNILPMWVADMDFPSPPEVQEAIMRRALHGTYGYSEPQADDWQAAIDFWQRRHGLTVKREEMTMLPCVVSGMKQCLHAATQPGDKVIINSPVYGPFRFSIAQTGRTTVDVPLLHDKATGTYDLDFDGMEQAMRDGAKAVLFCNPHNPTGRLWTREELTKLCELCDQYDVLLISDEIHADFELSGKMTPMLTLRQKKTYSLCAASKTFNLAGLQQALCFSKDPDLMEKVIASMSHCGMHSGNIFALEATRAAYEHGDAWLEGMKDYLRVNYAEMQKLLSELLPKAVMSPLQSTYLCWVDLNAYGHTTQEILDACAAEGVVFTGGEFFGENGSGFVRVNIACPTRYLRVGMERLAAAMAKLG